MPVLLKCARWPVTTWDSRTKLNQILTGVCLCLKKPAWVLASAHGVVPEHIRMSLTQRKCIWLEYGNLMALWKRDFIIDNDPWWCSSKQTSSAGELYTVMEKLAPLGLRVWVCLLLFPFRGAQAHLSSRYSSQRPKGETSSLRPEFERPVFRWTVEKKIFVEMVARASTHHPEGRLQGWVLGQNIHFLNLSFQG